MNLLPMINLIEFITAIVIQYSVHSTAKVQRQFIACVSLSPNVVALRSRAQLQLRMWPDDWTGTVYDSANVRIQQCEKQKNFCILALKYLLAEKKACRIIQNLMLHSASGQNTQILFIAFDQFFFAESYCIRAQHGV